MESAVILRSLYVVPDTLEARTYLLAPNDFLDGICQSHLLWSMFFKYDIDGDKLVEALKQLLDKYPIVCGRLRPNEKTRFVAEVDPSQGVTKGIPFTELKSEISIAAAILEHSQTRGDNADFPVDTDQPFFADKLDTEAFLKGHDPFMKVKLTHFADGCAVSVAMRHLMMDGHRFAELFRDLSRAYRGEEIPERELDRSYMWPDQLAKHFDLDEEVATLPRKVVPWASREQAVAAKYPNDTCQSVVLHFSNDTLGKMKDIVHPFLSDGEFVSSHDLIVAFGWMLECECYADEHRSENAADKLGFGETFACFAFEMLANGFNAVPDNYSGNAFALFPVVSPKLEEPGTSLTEIFAKAAISVRSMVKMARGQPQLMAQGLLAYYYAEESGKLPLVLDATKYRGAFSSLCKSAILGIDFGEGTPVWRHTTPSPLRGSQSSLVLGPGDDGIAVHAELRGSQLGLLKRSVVRKEVAPGMKELYTEFTIEELERKLTAQVPEEKS